MSARGFESWYEREARLNVESGEWTPEEAEDYVANWAYDEWRDFQAESELEAREKEDAI